VANNLFLRLKNAYSDQFHWSTLNLTTLDSRPAINIFQWFKILATLLKYEHITWWLGTIKIYSKIIVKWLGNSKYD